jgi:hypothetical protein
MNRFVDKIFNQINSTCKNYDGYNVTPSENIKIPLILEKYIENEQPLTGDRFVEYLCTELGYCKSEIDDLKKIRLWKELSIIGEKIHRKSNTKKEKK